MKTVFFDVDTQIDFLYASGALYVPRAESVVPAIAQLNRYAAAHRIPIISTVDAHLEDDIEFRTWPHHCVAGALGQRKAEATLIDGRVVLPNRAGAVDVSGAPQIVLEKQTVNVFDTATIAGVLDQLGADRFVVYGVATEICLWWSARGLLKAGKRVAVVATAIKEIDAANGAHTLEEIRAGGGEIIRLAEALAS